jgi:hypothetical protein
MAAHVDGSQYPSSTSKAVLDGPGGNEVARLLEYGKVTGGFGPSLSSPMIDAAGNIWFLSAIQYPDFRIATALIRAVYDPAQFAYELELVLESDSVFAGQNSGRNWLLTFLSVADSNSISSSTAFSQNISEVGHLGQGVSGLEPADPRTLGGLVLNAGILYDYDGDGNFVDCKNDPTSPDQSYNVLLYLGYPGSDLP